MELQGDGEPSPVSKPIQLQECQPGAVSHPSHPAHVHSSVRVHNIQGGLGATAAAGEKGGRGWWSAAATRKSQAGSTWSKEEGKKKPQEPTEKRRQREDGRDSGTDLYLLGHSQHGTGKGQSAAGRRRVGFCVTHDRKHIRCKRSRSCRPSARGRRHRCPWSCRPPCGSRRRPVCQRLAPGR